MSGRGRSGSRISAKAKVERDRQVVVDRARGLRWPTIAQRHGITVRQCQNIFTEYRANAVATEDPPRVVDEVLEQLDALIEEAALLAEQTPNDAVRLGSINTRFKIMETRFNVMQAAGLMPPMSSIMREVEARKLTGLVIAFLTERIGDDPEWKREFLARVQKTRATRAELVAGPPTTVDEASEVPGAHSRKTVGRLKPPRSLGPGP